MTPPVGFDWKALLLYMKERRVVPIMQRSRCVNSPYLDSSVKAERLKAAE
jgi:hypothetical protein